MSHPHEGALGSAGDFDLASTPLRIGTVTLNVRDIDHVSRFYQEVVGVRLLGSDTSAASLGAEATPLLELRGDPDLRPGDPHAAGLFHTAFLLPSRADLARWASHAAENRVPLTGAADHAVSEALYLSDPEGNGIEMYADRPSRDWEYRDGMVVMVNDPLDFAGLLATAGGEVWDVVPDETVVGHVHLQVGEIAAAEAFYGGVLGFRTTCRYRRASFFGAGGYYHQLATNVWHSSGAGTRDDRTAGLAGFEILADGDALGTARDRARSAGTRLAEAPDGLTVFDPWSIPVTLRAT